MTAWVRHDHHDGVRISVVIPTWNRATLLAAALDSVISQADENTEIIVVDDGSTDATPRVLAAYGTRIRVITQANAGAGAARNRGVAASTGEYIAFLDSDDLWFPWTITTYREVVARHGCPSLVMGTPSWTPDVPPPASAGVSLRARRWDDYLSSSSTSFWTGTGGAMIRADALRATGGFAERRMNAEDLDLLLRLGDAEGFVQIESPPTFFYRRHADSALSQPDRTVDGMENLLRRAGDGTYPGGPSRQRQVREIVCREVRATTHHFLRVGDPSRAWALYRRTFAWQLRFRRFRYLLAAPLMCVGGVLRHRHPR